jgi:tellurite resistance protein
MSMLQPIAEMTRLHRMTATPDNPFMALERLTSKSVMQNMNLMRDVRDAFYENAFISIYGSPFMHLLGDARANTPAKAISHRQSADVQKALAEIGHGDLAAAVVRMLILLAGSRGSVRKDRLERSAHILNDTPPFKNMGPDRRGELIHKQSIIVEFEPKRALETLPQLLKAVEDREKALKIVKHILGARTEMAAHSLHLLQRMESLLGVRNDFDADVGRAHSVPVAVQAPTLN